jgi:hypothetical protein
MSVQICRFIRVNGNRCGSPALTGQALCYYHHRDAVRHRSLATPDTESTDGTPTTVRPIHAQNFFKHEPAQAHYLNVIPAGPLALDIPPLEDRAAIQVALSMLLTALAHDRIDSRRAQTLLYGLQVASNNARNLSLAPSRSHAVTSLVYDEATGLDIAPDETPAFELDREALLQAILDDEANADSEDDVDAEESRSALSTTW